MNSGEIQNYLAERNIPKEDWVSPKVEIKDSPLEGKGMFAKEPISEGEVVIKWGGTTIYTDEDIKLGRVRPHSSAEIDEGLYLAGDPNQPSELTDFTNHSCDPNLWMIDAITLAARRPIKTGEEITADYAMWEGDPDWRIRAITCNCGAELCRHQITGNDWKLPELQERYKGHFSPFINRRIEKLQKI